MKKIVCTLCILILSFTMTVPVYAEDTTESGTEIATEAYSGYKEEEKIENDVTNTQGIVQILYGYEFEDGSFDTWFSVPGVAVGENTVITGYKGIEKNDATWTKITEERINGYEALGINIKEITELSCKIYDGNGFLKSASVHGIYDQITIIDTAEAINDISPISQEGIIIGENAYASGFSTELLDTLHYVEKTDLMIQKVELTGSDSNGNIQYSAQTSNSYTAIYNEYDEIVAVIIGRSYSAIPVSSVRSTLDSEGIPYLLAEKAEELDYKAINEAIQKAEGINGEDYTEESVEKLTTLVEEGKALIGNKRAKQAEIDEKASEIEEAYNGLEQKSNKSVVTLITTIVMVTITVAFLLFVIIRIARHPELMKEIGKNGFFEIFKKQDVAPNERTRRQKAKEQKKKPRVQAKTAGQQSPEQPDNTFIAPAAVRRPVIQNEMNAQDYPPQLPAIYTGRQSHIAEQGTWGRNEITQIIAPQDEAGTSVLTTGSMAYITRKSTGESMYLTSFPFTIGKSRTASFVLDNETVSRIHVQISCLKGEYIIFDNNSTNGTYVDKYKIIPMTAVPLKDGSEIIISNEIFIFRYGGA